jgi:hypothetical protein
VYTRHETLSKSKEQEKVRPRRFAFFE